jgi:uncharacterized protein (DUF2252 family)
MVDDESRKRLIIEVLEAAFADLMRADPHAFRVKYRKMAADPFAFFRGSACLFYSDVTGTRDRFVDERTSRIWIHGDLHAENFGTYLNSDGRLVFDVNDFDEAYVGCFTWDLRRFAASLALLGWQKALPEKTVRNLIDGYVGAYLDQVDHYLASDSDDDFGLYLHNTDGPVHAILVRARQLSRLRLLDGATVLEGGVRVFRDGPGVRRLDREERDTVMRAFEGYLTTIPESKRFDRELFYEVRDVVGRSGFGIGSAGLPAYNILVEGFSQTLENDVVLSMKQANVPAVSRFLDDAEVEGYFEHEGHRTVVSQRALQVHTDPLLGHTSMDGRGYVVSEVSPYELDLDWSDLNEPEEMGPLVESLGRATAKVHCASDEDSDQDLVELQVEEAVAEVLDERREEFTEDVVDFGVDYAERVRADHALFVSAFREGEIGGVTAT